METRLGRLAQTPRSRTEPPIKPELFVGRLEAQLGKAVGLMQFGVNHLTLEPGSYSSLRHWHEGEDEFLFVLSGEITLIDDHGEHLLAAGDYVGFPAGMANAHHLVNRSSGPTTALVVGTRKQGLETIHYPDDDIGAVTVHRGTDGSRVEN